jgi:hypothetical protein
MNQMYLRIQKNQRMRKILMYQQSLKYQLILRYH